MSFGGFGFKKAPKFVAVFIAVAIFAAACGSDDTVGVPDAAAPTAARVAPAVTPGAPEAARTPSPTALPSPTATASAAPSTADSPSPTSTPTAATTTTAAPVVAPARPTTTSVSSTIAALSENAWDTLVSLTREFSPRESATEQELAAAEHLLREFQALGYEARLQPFSFEALSADSRVLTLSSPSTTSFDAVPMSFSGEGRVSGVFVDVGLAAVEDVPADLSGKIALVQRGRITFQDKVRRVEAAGAVGAVIYNNQPGLFGGTLVSQARIPVVAISRSDGITIKALMSDGDVEGSVAVVNQIFESRNVIAELDPLPSPGGREGTPVVVLGGHFDTVPNTEGANDNGSGIATLLTLAREVSGRSYPFALSFVTFGAEEVGLLGSRHYVASLSESERDQVLAMLNFDALGSGKDVQLLGTPELTASARDFGEANGIAIEALRSLGGFSSDHAPFADASIPHLAFFADDFSRINSPADDIEFVQPELLGKAVLLGLATLDTLAAE